jgi:poly-beta-1,6-N-acetyl-D-glucosamine synthase
MKYSIITPVKNEFGNIQKTIESVSSQKIKPLEWIILNDNSNDGTENVLLEAAKKYDWLKVINVSDFNITDYSCRVVHLFNLGYNQLKEIPEFICKLDADVQFESDFYQNILHEFQQNERLGIASGHLTTNGIPEKQMETPYICTRGATKVYRTQCLKDIGGIILFQGWDTMDNVAARAKNWEVRIVPVYFEHLKEEGSKVGNKFYYQFRIGVYNGRIPYRFSFFFIKALSKTFEKPFILTFFLQLYGYFKGRLNKKRPYPSYVVKQLHKEQINTLRQKLGK